MNVNPTTYKTLDSPGYWEVHAIGAVWAEILWVVAQRLITKHGFSDTLFPPAPLENGTIPEGDFYRPTEYTATGQPKPLVPKHGNSLTLQLLINAMKLQPCNPSFFASRDAIILADLTLTGGDNFCDLWGGFAERGLGPNARVFGRTPWGGGFRTNVSLPLLSSVKCAHSFCRRISTYQQYVKSKHLSSRYLETSPYLSFCTLRYHSLYFCTHVSRGCSFLLYKWDHHSLASLCGQLSSSHQGHKNDCSLDGLLMFCSDTVQDVLSDLRLYVCRYSPRRVTLSTEVCQFWHIQQNRMSLRGYWVRFKHLTKCKG